MKCGLCKNAKNHKMQIKILNKNNLQMKNELFI